MRRGTTGSNPLTDQQPGVRGQPGLSVRHEDLLGRCGLDTSTAPEVLILINYQPGVSTTLRVATPARSLAMPGGPLPRSECTGRRVEQKLSVRSLTVLGMTVTELGETITVASPDWSLSPSRALD